MKAKYILVSLLLVALVMGGTGYSVSAGSGDKATGGGTFTQKVATSPLEDPNPYGALGDKISFGFNAQSQGDGAKGRFTLINHNSGMKVFGTVSACSAPNSSVQIAGTCSIDGSEKSFRAKLTDGGEGSGYDEVRIWFGDNTNPLKPDIYGLLYKGNIQKHK
jgi:hypothetical protein